jgi:hypothetical protein
MRTWAQYTAEASRGEQSRIEELQCDNLREQLSLGLAGKEQDSRVWTVCDVIKSPPNLPKPTAPKSTERKATKPTLSCCRYWCFSPAKLQQLKRDTSARTPGWISTNDSLCALLWHRSSLYRKLSARGFETSSCRISIDVRSRMQQAIPAEFVGNVVSMFVAQVLVAEFERDDGMASVASLAQKIRQSLGLAGALFSSWIAEANSLPSDNAFHHPSGSVVAPNILTKDHSKCDTCRLHWGVLGRVESIRGLDQSYPFPTVALCFFMPALADGWLEVARACSIIM